MPEYQVTLLKLLKYLSLIYFIDPMTFPLVPPSHTVSQMSVYLTAVHTEGRTLLIL